MMVINLMNGLLSIKLTCLSWYLIVKSRKVFKMFIWTPLDDERWQGIFGLHTKHFTIHVLPRGNWKRWGYKNRDGWKSFDFGPLIAICWGSDESVL